MSSWETACRAELADEETRLQGDMHQRASNDSGSASATVVREVVLAAEAVPSITYLPRGDGSSSRSYHAKAEYDKWKQGRAEQGKGATAPQREEVPEVRVTHPNPKPEEDEEPTSFWAKAQRVLKRIGEAMGGNDGGSSALGRAIGGSNNSTSQNSTPHGLTSFEDVPPKSSTPKQQRTAHKRTDKNTTAQNKTVSNSTTAQQAGSLREVAADRGCQPREVAADSLSVELQARLNSKFEALSAITAGLEGDGFWVQHRPEEWVYGPSVAFPPRTWEPAWNEGTAHAPRVYHRRQKADAGAPPRPHARSARRRRLRRATDRRSMPSGRVHARSSRQRQRQARLHLRLRWPRQLVRAGASCRLQEELERAGRLLSRLPGGHGPQGLSRYARYAWDGLHCPRRLRGACLTIHLTLALALALALAVSRALTLTLTLTRLCRAEPCALCGPHLGRCPREARKPSRGAGEAHTSPDPYPSLALALALILALTLAPGLSLTPTLILRRRGGARSARTGGASWS
eukprot:scaffold102165_cov51-Phaeocystis_antarctica.AAC.3